MSQQWDIRREGRAWGSGEALQRYSLAPDRIEMVHGRLLADDEERLTLLALLLENVGVDRAVRLGDPAVWLEAVQGLDLEADIAAGTTAEDPNLPSGAAALSPEARACAGLLGRFMSDLSEDHWAAAWLIDLEFVLWSAVRGESRGRCRAPAISVVEVPRLDHVERLGAPPAVCAALGMGGALHGLALPP